MSLAVIRHPGMWHSFLDCTKSVIGPNHSGTSCAQLHGYEHARFAAPGVLMAGRAIWAHSYQKELQKEWYLFKAFFFFWRFSANAGQSWADCQMSLFGWTLDDQSGVTLCPYQNFITASVCVWKS